MTRIYSKTGDLGETCLIGGKRVLKSSLRVEACGELDELNSFLGLVMAQGIDEPLQSIVDMIQHDLFSLGSDLADTRPDCIPRINDNTVHGLERHIDQLSAQLPELNRLIIPGGSPVASVFHVARAVCRRAERVITALQQEENIPKTTLPYLNRLSDLLFVMARFQNRQDNFSDRVWNPSSERG